MPSAYIEISIEADPPLIEKLVAVLAQTGIEGFWEESGMLRCYVSKERWSDALRVETERVLQIVARSSSSPTPKLSSREVEQQNWNESWEKTIQPIRVTESITVTPSWHQVIPKEGQLVLVIDPKMSFGTGYHETTRLSLRLLQDFLSGAPRVLDVGTGTGILAIAAAKLGAASVVGIDIDAWAYDNANENAERNDVTRFVRIRQQPLTALSPEPFDLIVANIQLDVIAELIDEMLVRLTPQGRLILSGLLSSDKSAITSLITSRGLVILKELVENEWIALAASRDERRSH